MEDQRIIEQLLGIFTLNEVRYLTAEDKRSFLVPYGSAGIYVYVHENGDDVVVTLQARLLEQIDLAQGRREKILEELNSRNQALFFGRLYCDLEQAMIILEYDLFANDLQGSQLMASLGVIASMADGLDDELSDKLGTGVKSEQARERLEGKADDLGSGPVVSA